jgi:tRNA-uridine 2-sulfurtransferase
VARVLVAMSGGVDSSVAAALLVEQGHEVVGATLKLWGGESDSGCCSVADVDDARRVARQLGIDHLVFNFTEDFDTHVVQPYLADHGAGRTPNPCIECNRHLKFDRLLARGMQLGFDAVATGHHARVEHDGQGWRLRRGADRAKDQSYVVHVLDQARLARTWFPVGGMTKAEVRAHAERTGLRTAAKPDSQDVCFITSTGGRESFLGTRIPLRPGRVVDTDGHEVGTVPAVELVTIGQRKGLHLGGHADRRYVVDVDVPAAVVTIGDREQLLTRTVRIDAWTWTDRPVPHGARVLVQVSAHGTPMAGVVADATITFDEPQRRVAAGQSVVLYDLDDRTVLAGATAVRD